MSRVRRSSGERWCALTLLALFGDIDLERATAELLAVQLADRLGRILIICHGDESETAWTPAPRTSDNNGFFHLAGLRKDFAQIVASGFEGEITYIESYRHEQLDRVFRLKGAMSKEGEATADNP